MDVDSLQDIQQELQEELQEELRLPFDTWTWLKTNKYDSVRDECEKCVRAV